MDTKTATEMLGKEWAEEDGFFSQLRLGKFDPMGYERVYNTLELVDVSHNTKLEKEFVAVTWFIPLFMEWQKMRVSEVGGDVQVLETAINKLIPSVYRILGLP